MVLAGPGQRLILERRPIPDPGPGQVLLRVRACAVCRTDLHVIDGERGVHQAPTAAGWR